MAKGEQRGNRETKKPKQNKVKPPQSALSNVGATFKTAATPQPKKGGKS